MLRKRKFKSLTIKVFAIAIFALASFYACKDDSKQTLRNGYEYEILESKGETTPRPSQIVSLDLQLIDEFGNVLDDSRDAEIRPAIQIPEQRTLQTDKNPLLALVELMGVGDSARVVVPVDSLPDPPQEFKQSEYIDYRLKILNIEDEDKYRARMMEQTRSRDTANNAELQAKEAVAKEAIEAYQEGTLEGRKINVEGGMVIQMVEDTKGELPVAGERVDVHYFGFLKDGTPFDNSYRTGRPYSLTVGRGGSIEGWLKGIPKLPAGSSAVMDIPPSMGYGERGNPPVIPPNADLLFYVTIDKVYKNK